MQARPGRFWPPVQAFQATFIFSRSRMSGTQMVAETMAEPGTKVRVGQTVLKYNVENAAVSDQSQPAKPLMLRGELSGLLHGTHSKTTASPALASHGTEPAAAPSVRHLARKMNIDLASIRGALGAGSALAWARALGEFGATITFAGSFAGRTETMPLAISRALNTDVHAAILLSLVLLGVSVAVLASLRDRWLGAA